MSLTTLTVSRTIPSTALTVKIDITGSAILGTNYSLVSGADSLIAGVVTVTIPNNAVSKDVVFDVIPQVLSSNKTTIFTLVDSDEAISITPKTQSLIIYVSPVGDILDQMAVKPGLYYCLNRRGSASYTGAAFQVERVADGLLLDIPFLADGSINFSAMLTFGGTGSLRVVKIYNMGTAGSGFPIVQTVPSQRPLIMENGVLITRHGRLSMKQTPTTRMIVPTFDFLGGGNRPYTINYVGGLAGTDNKAVLGCESPIFTLGFYQGFYRSFYAVSAGSSTSFPALSATNKINLRIFSATSPNLLSNSMKFYDDGIPVLSATPVSLPSKNLTTNSESAASGNSYFSEFACWTQGDSVLPQLQTLEQSQRIWYNTANNDTSLLLRFEGTNGSTTFTDSSIYAALISRNGDAQISTTEVKFGASSLSLPTTTSSVFLPTGSIYNIATGEDFTIRMFIKPSVSLAANSLARLFYNNSATAGLIINNDRLEFRVPGAGVVLGTVTPFSLTAWTYVAVKRLNDVITLWVNGNLVFTSPSINSPITLQGSLIGGGWTGSVDSVIYTKGQGLDCSIVPLQDFPLPVLVN
jgi:Concanavalin A-like lectin/glucanases superfamily